MEHVWSKGECFARFGKLWKVVSIGMREFSMPVVYYVPHDDPNDLATWDYTENLRLGDCKPLSEEDICKFLLES